MAQQVDQQVTQQVDQLKVFTSVIKAMDSGKKTEVEQAECLIKKALLENKKHRSRKFVFYLSQEEITFLNKLST